MVELAAVKDDHFSHDLIFKKLHEFFPEGFCAQTKDIDLQKNVFSKVSVEFLTQFFFQKNCEKFENSHNQSNVIFVFVGHSKTSTDQINLTVVACIAQ